MNERESRAVVGQLCSLEQVLQPERIMPPGGLLPDPPDDFGSDYNVLSHLDDQYVRGPGLVSCTVAGRLHCYAYSWHNLPEFSNARGRGRLELIRIIGYRNGYCRHERESDDLQSRTVARRAKALEMASPRAMGPEYTLHNLHVQRQADRDRRTVRYQSVGPGSALTVCVVVGKYPSKFGVHSLSVPSLSCNRCDLVQSPTGELRREYVRCHWTDAGETAGGKPVNAFPEDTDAESEPAEPEPEEFNEEEFCREFDLPF